MSGAKNKSRHSGESRNLEPSLVIEQPRRNDRTVAEGSVASYIINSTQVRHSRDSGNPVPLVRLTDVAALNPRRFDDLPKDDELVSFIPMRAVEEESGRLSATETKHWADVKKGYTPFQNGDVIFAKITPCMENGKYALATGLHGGRAAGSTEFHVFRPKSELDSKFLLHFLFTLELRSLARMNMKGAAGQLRVPARFFDDVQIPLPSIEEQRRIVAELETQLARREGRTYESGAELLTQILQARRAQLEKLHGPATRKKYHDPDMPDLSELKELPEGWTWATAEQLTDETRAITYGVIKLGKEISDGIPILRSSDVRHLRLNLNAVKRIAPEIANRFRRTFLHGGEVLVTVRGTLGGVVVVPDVCKGCNNCCPASRVTAIVVHFYHGGRPLLASRSRNSFISSWDKPARPDFPISSFSLASFLCCKYRKSIIVLSS